MLDEKKPLIIAVDGRSASGKSTFSQELKREPSAEIIHMDDFFLRPEQRTPERPLEIGGNVDRERFLQEVAGPLKDYQLKYRRPTDQEVLLSYRKYDCSVQQLADTVNIRKSPLIVVEGAYSCHPDLTDLYDLRIFMEAGEEEQRRRIARRNGKQMLSRFVQEWIPKENTYFETFCIAQKSNFILS